MPRRDDDYDDEDDDRPAPRRSSRRRRDDDDDDDYDDRRPTGPAPGKTGLTAFLAAFGISSGLLLGIVFVLLLIPMVLCMGCCLVPQIMAPPRGQQNFQNNPGPGDPVAQPAQADQVANDQPAAVSLPKGQLWPREDFKKALVGLTPDEVRKKAGNPDASFEVGGPRNKITWSYRGKTTDPAVGKPDVIANVNFEDGVVISVTFA